MTRLGARAARLPLAARIAATAGALTLVLLVCAALLVRGALHAAQLTATENLAAAQADQIVGAIEADQPLGGRYGALPFEVVAADGGVVASSPELEAAEAALGAPAAGAGRPVMPVPTADDESGSDGRIVGERWTITIQDGPLAGQTLTALSATTAPAGTATTGQDSVRAYVFATPTAADQVTDDLDPFLWGGVLLVVVLVTTTAALAARRALRPVERMRRTVASITGASFAGRSATDVPGAGRSPTGVPLAGATAGPPEPVRVDVPEAHDELRALAITLNGMLDRLDDAALRQRRFTADAAHELRSPIASLLAALEIADAHPDAFPPAEALAHVAVEARRLQRLADDLLELSTAGRAPESSPAGERGGGDSGGDDSDVGELLAELLADPGLAASHPDIRAVVLPRAPEAAGRIRVAVGRTPLWRILRNLLENAFRHARTTVRITLGEEDAGGGRVVIDIANDGPAIPEDLLAAVFRPFVRLDEARARDTGGSGLGLAMVEELVTAAGGSVEVTSAASRTAFVVRLPRAGTTPETAKAPAR